jgi:hypothetical protein
MIAFLGLETQSFVAGNDNLSGPLTAAECRTVSNLEMP